MVTQNLKPANTQRQYKVSAQQASVCCPTPEMQLWNSHPRVYLAMEQGHAVCPYCNAEFISTPTAQEP